MAYRIAFALYSARNFPPLETQLAEVKAMGYDAVEPFMPNLEGGAKEFRKKIDDVGLACYGAHLPYAGITGETAKFIDIAKTIGAKFMIAPWLPPEQRGKDTAAWQKIGEALGKASGPAGSAGLKVLWHNHDFEYATLPDGTRPIDRLFEAAGNDVGFEIDVAWVLRGKADPAAELKRYADRINVIQVKDTAPPGTTKDDGWTPTGDGIVDWQAIFPLFAGTSADHLCTEHDNPADYRVFGRRSIDFLKKLEAGRQGGAPA